MYNCLLNCTIHIDCYISQVIVYYMYTNMSCISFTYLSRKWLMPWLRHFIKGKNLLINYVNFPLEEDHFNIQEYESKILTNEKFQISQKSIGRRWLSHMFFNLINFRNPIVLLLLHSSYSIILQSCMKE